MIKTLIFDFGDVFINLDKPAIERELLKLGIPQIDSAMFDVAFEYEKGLISTRSLISYFTNRFPSLTEDQIEFAWNSIILDFPEYRLEFIESLAKSQQYKLILLSNTNELHINKVKENMTLSRFIRFQSYFDEFYLSHEINLSKPHLNIYEFVLNQNQLLASECLFVDDTLINTEAAEKLAIHTWNIDPEKEDVISIFETKKDLF